MEQYLAVPLVILAVLAVILVSGFDRGNWLKTLLYLSAVIACGTFAYDFWQRGGVIPF